MMNRGLALTLLVASICFGALFAMAAVSADVTISPNCVEVLVAPKCSKVARFAAADLTNHLSKVLGCDGFNLLQNNNEVAGQTVFHFHIHLIPR